MIHLIITGGTIDSYYDGSKDTVRPLKVSTIPNYIQSLKLGTSKGGGAVSNGLHERQ